VWKTEVQQLPNPWRTWLSDTELIGPSSGVAVLYIPHALEGLSDSFEFCAKAWGLAKSVHPDLKSLIVSSDVIYGLVLEGTVVLSDVKVHHGRPD
jgi:hypothetical protein